MKAHIFDLDGTLLDSMGVWENIDQVCLEKRGIKLPGSYDYDSYVEAITPLTPLESAVYAINYFGLKGTPEELKQEWNEMAEHAYSNHIPLKPGAKEYLQNLRDQQVRMAVATSSPLSLCVPALQNHGITDLFDAICTSEEVGCGKNRPDVYLLAAKRLGVEPQDCIVYEDSLTALKTAKSIGMTVYAVYDSASEKNWEEMKRLADYIVESF